MRRWISVTLALMLTALFLPLSALAGTDFVPALDTNASCSVTVASNYANFEALEAEFDRFNEYYPNVELTYNFLDSYNSTIALALDSEEAPDIFGMFTWMEGREMYVPLYEAAANLADPALSIDLGVIQEGLISTQEDGSVRMAPVFSSTYGMLVNEDLFAREGIAVPGTYQDLLDVCARFRELGYTSPIMGYNSSQEMAATLSNAIFSVPLKDDRDTVEALNALDASAAGVLREGLVQMLELVEAGCIDLEACGALENNYNAVILRFFEGDVPMMLVTGDTVSGTAKRESQSEAFQVSPFVYRFYTRPVTEEGGYYLNAPTVEFAVNRNSENLDMALEFMRFLVDTEELNRMAEVKRLVTVSNDLSYDGVYAALGEVDAAHTASEAQVGLTDDAKQQIRRAAYHVLNGLMTVDEAIENYGNFAEDL